MAHMTSKLVTVSRPLHSPPPSCSASPTASLMMSLDSNGMPSSAASGPANVVLPAPGGPFTTTNRTTTVKHVVTTGSRIPAAPVQSRSPESVAERSGAGLQTDQGSATDTWFNADKWYDG